MRKIKAGKRG